jgi:hypothetical protein
MTLGDILKESGLVVETRTMKASTDCTKGYLYCDDGSGGGLVVATPTLAATNKVVMALETKVYATDTTNGVAHTLACVVKGNVVVAKVSGSGLAYVDSKLMISGTSGAVTKFVAGDVTGTVNQSTANAAALVNNGVVGFASKLSADADVVQEMWLGAP